MSDGKKQPPTFSDSLVNFGDDLTNSSCGPRTPVVVRQLLVVVNRWYATSSYGLVNFVI